MLDIIPETLLLQSIVLQKIISIDIMKFPGIRHSSTDCFAYFKQGFVFAFLQNYYKNINELTDGQQVRTFLNWLIEYDAIVTSGEKKSQTHFKKIIISTIIYCLVWFLFQYYPWFIFSKMQFKRYQWKALEINTGRFFLYYNLKNQIHDCYFLRFRVMVD